MSQPDEEKRYVHLVGSVPLASNTEVFTLASRTLSGHIHRIPDGETEARSNWIAWQFPLLANTPYFEPATPDDVGEYKSVPKLKLVSGVASDAIRLPALGYSQAAQASYKEFARLKNEGVIPADVRFQVSLPTPLAPVHFFVRFEDIQTVEPVYERQLLSELDEILAGIPADELAIQWDTAVEFALLEGAMPTPYADVRSLILEMLLRIGSHVPDAVQLGYHLCYGDSGHAHFVEPNDTSRLVMVANAIAAGLQRPLNWIHLPVPRDRHDDAYFEPLKNLKLHPETELYLGLVHYADGTEGAQKRIAAAERYVQSFGIATECGFGRRDPHTIPDLMKIHAEIVRHSP